MTIPTYEHALQFSLPIINGTNTSVHQPSFSLNTKVWMMDNSIHYTYHFYNTGTNALVIVEEFDNEQYKEIKPENIPSNYLYPIFWKFTVEMDHFKLLYSRAVLEK